MTKFKVGDKVRLLVDKTPYGSDYGGSPKVTIKAGMVGTVGAINVAAVRFTKHHYFNCVDFILPGVFRGNPKYENTTWRCSVYNDEMKLI